MANSKECVLIKIIDKEVPDYLRQRYVPITSCFEKNADHNTMINSGSQFVGMGKKLLNVPKVDRMFELANHVFKTDILSLCLNGPKSELDKTVNCQPAVFVTSLAAVEYLKESNPHVVADCYATAGFSIGEYCSLVLAGSISFEDALKVIKVRAESMQKASESLPSGLMTVFLGRQSKLNMAMLASRKWCKDKLKLDEPIECEISNYLNSQCKVVGGNKEALDFLELNHKEFAINKVKRLSVSGAFHTSLMKSVEADLKTVLKNTEIKKPLIKFHCNFNSKSLVAPEKIRYFLTKQVAHPVKWEQTLNELFYNDNLPTDQEPDQDQDPVKKPLQLGDRVYPDIYECGPASHTGPILKTLNYKAYRYYKHIGV